MQHCILTKITCWYGSFKLHILVDFFFLCTYSLHHKQCICTIVGSDTGNPYGLLTVVPFAVISIPSVSSNRKAEDCPPLDQIELLGCRISMEDQWPVYLADCVVCLIDCTLSWWIRILTGSLLRNLSIPTYRLLFMVQLCSRSRGKWGSCHPILWWLLVFECFRSCRTDNGSWNMVSASVTKLEKILS